MAMTCIALNVGILGADCQRFEHVPPAIDMLHKPTKLVSVRQVFDFSTVIASF